MFVGKNRSTQRYAWKTSNSCNFYGVLAVFRKTDKIMQSIIVLINGVDTNQVIFKHNDVLSSSLPHDLPKIAAIQLIT